MTLDQTLLMFIIWALAYLLADVELDKLFKK